MKKVFPVIGLILGSAAVSAAFGFGGLLLILLLNIGGLLIDIVLVIGVWTLLGRLNYFCEKRGMKPVVYWLCTLVPPAAGAACAFAYYSYLDSIGHWDGVWFGGLFEALFAMSWGIAAAAFLLGGAITLLVNHIVKRKKIKAE